MIKLTVICKISHQQSCSDRVDNTAWCSKLGGLVDEENNCQWTQQQSNANTSCRAIEVTAVRMIQSTKYDTNW